MNVGELLKRRPSEVLTLPGDTPIREAVDRMASLGVRCAVVTEAGSPAGLFTGHEVARFIGLQPDLDLAAISLREAMKAGLVSADAGDDLRSVFQTMVRAGIGYLPVVEEGRVTGMLDLAHVAEALVDLLDHELDHLHDYIVDLQEARTD